MNAQPGSPSRWSLGWEWAKAGANGNRLTVKGTPLENCPLHIVIYTGFNRAF